MKSNNLDSDQILKEPLWPHIAQRPVFLYLPQISKTRNLMLQTPIIIGTDGSFEQDARQGRYLHSDGTGEGHEFDQPFQLGSGHDFTFFMVYRFDLLPATTVVFATQTGASNRGLSFTQNRAGANGGSFRWTKGGVTDVDTGLPNIFLNVWNIISITYKHSTGNWIAVHRSLGKDPNNLDNSYETSVATGTEGSDFKSNTSGSWVMGASRTGGADLNGDIAFIYFSKRNMPEALIKAWVEDWRAPFRIPARRSFLAPVAALDSIFLATLQDTGRGIGQARAARLGGELQ